MEPATSYAQHSAPLPTAPPAGEDICHLVEHLLLLPLYLTLPTSLFHPPPQLPPMEEVPPTLLV